MLTTSVICSGPLLRAGQLEVSLATTMEEIDAAMRLRFEVFNLELQEGLLSSYDRGYDTDAYDAFCDHLIVRDLPTGRIVGTYRLLRQREADRQIGFYSENEFDLTRLRQTAREKRLELLELGRSCIAASHRSFATINLLWAAIARYAIENGAGLLFGCGSLHETEPTEIARLYRHLSQQYLAPPIYRVTPVDSCRIVFPDGWEDRPSTDDEARSIARRLPTILRGYLRTGALIAGEPALDRAFGTADVLVLLNLGQLSDRYKQHYVG
ncbi:MAG: GNAT family N-acetyltransferase [Blastocatellia bacterium]|jgi:putative hemolysin